MNSEKKSNKNYYWKFLRHDCDYQDGITFGSVHKPDLHKFKSIEHLKINSLSKRYSKLTSFQKKLVIIKNKFARILSLYQKSYKLCYNKYGEVYLRNFDNLDCYYEILHYNDNYIIKFKFPGNVLYNRFNSTLFDLNYHVFDTDHFIIDDVVINKMIDKYYTKEEFLNKLINNKSAMSKCIILPKVLLEIVYSYLIMGYL